MVPSRPSKNLNPLQNPCERIGSTSSEQTKKPTSSLLFEEGLLAASHNIRSELPKKILFRSARLRHSQNLTRTLTHLCRNLKSPVPIGIGIPMMMHSLTPSIISVLPWMAASNRWSVVFSNEASMSTESFIFAIPNRVIPRISPCKKRKHTIGRLRWERDPFDLMALPMKNCIKEVVRHLSNDLALQRRKTSVSKEGSP
jgi:hypothetical protein